MHRTMKHNGSGWPSWIVPFRCCKKRTELMNWIFRGIRNPQPKIYTREIGKTFWCFSITIASVSAKFVVSVWSTSGAFDFSFRWLEATSFWWKKTTFVFAAKWWFLFVLCAFHDYDLRKFSWKTSDIRTFAHPHSKVADSRVAKGRVAESKSLWK